MQEITPAILGILSSIALVMGAIYSSPKDKGWSWIAIALVLALWQIAFILWRKKQ